MRRRTKNLRSLTIWRYMARLINLNKYLASFPEATLTVKISVIEWNKIILNSMRNSWSKQAYVQLFYYESITFWKAINMFEHMEISESIYKGAV